MQIFKKYVKIVLFFCIGGFLIFAANEAYTESTYAKLMFYELYHQKNNIDLFFSGGSHTYRSFVPSVFDGELRVNSFNLGTSSQTYEGGYFLLKEALNRNKPSTVIMEITYASMENIENETKQADYILLDYMNNGANKYNYIKSAIIASGLADAIIPCYRNRSTKNPIDAVKNLWNKWNSGYFIYEPIKNSRNGQLIEEYKEKGFVYSYQSFGESGLEVEPYPWKVENINSEKVAWLKKTTNLCKEKGIDVIWVTAPIPEVSVLKLGNYEEINLFIQQLAEETGVEYYDFNYYKREYLPRNDRIYFYDSNHMNGIYAELFSHEMAKFLKQRKAGTFEEQKYFYSSYKEWEENYTEQE